MTGPKEWRLATRAVHAGKLDSGLDSTPTVAPIHQSVTYRPPTMQALDDVFAGDREGYIYARYGNPTVDAFERGVASLEAGEAALAFSSGMAAIHAALLAVGARNGTAVVAAQDLYGATHSLLTDLMSSQGVTVRFVDTNDRSAVEAACAALKPVAVLVETISNPLLRVANVPMLADVAHVCGATLLVDSTFATPALVQPLALGADIVIHSATKYLSGHGDVLGGVIVTSEEVRAEAHEVLKLTGGNLGPQDAWLALRGLRTLTLRMGQHCENALTVAGWLEKQPRIRRVHYPGLLSHQDYDLATSLLRKRGYGGMVSFEIVNAGKSDVFQFLEALRLCVPATTLGDVQSLLLYPAHSSHRALSAEERNRVGIGDGLVRMSVGIEAIADILDDLQQALAALDQRAPG